MFTTSDIYDLVLAETLDYDTSSTYTLSVTGGNNHGDTKDNYVSQYTVHVMARPTGEPTTSRPTRKPTNSPTKTKTAPTSVPTSFPTAADTVDIAVEMTLDASAPPTATDEANIKATISSSLGVDLSAIRHFTVTYDASRRRRLSSNFRRDRRLTTYVWTVTFDVVASLSAVGEPSAKDFAAAIVSTLEGDAFATSLMSAVSSVTGVESVSDTVESSDDGSNNDDGTSPRAASIFFVMVVIGGFVVVMAALTPLLMRYYQSRKNRRDGTMGEPMLMPVDAVVDVPRRAAADDDDDFEDNDGESVRPNSFTGWTKNPTVRHIKKPNAGLRGTMMPISAPRMTNPLQAEQEREVDDGL